MLNIKQEKFIQNIVKGMSQREAYKEAYGATYADKDIDSKACNLFNSDKVQTRYKELIKELEDDSIMSAKERMKWLTGVVYNKQLDEDQLGFKPADLNTKMKAIDILNKMSGEYIQKIDANVDSKLEISVELEDE